MTTNNRKPHDAVAGASRGEDGQSHYTQRASDTQLEPVLRQFLLVSRRVSIMLAFVPRTTLPRHALCFDVARVTRLVGEFLSHGGLLYIMTNQIEISAPETEFNVIRSGLPDELAFMGADLSTGPWLLVERGAAGYTVTDCGAPAELVGLLTTTPDPATPGEKITSGSTQDRVLDALRRLLAGDPAPSVRTIARAAGLPIRTVERTIGRLVADGVIAKITRRGRPSELRIVEQGGPA